MVAVVVNPASSNAEDGGGSHEYSTAMLAARTRPVADLLRHTVR